MGQMICVDEEEYDKYKYYANLTEEYMKFLDELREMMYPNIKYWIDTGSTVQVNEAFIERVEEDYKLGYTWKKSFFKKS